MKLSVMNKFYFIYLAFLPFVYETTYAQITLFDKKVSSYIILLPENPSSSEEKAAYVFQDYFNRVSNYKLKVIKESKGNYSDRDYKKKHIISIGSTNLSKPYFVDLPSEGFLIEQANQILIFQGTGKGILYGVYSFIEEILDCRKWYTNEDAICPLKTRIIVPSNYRRQEEPAFKYREVYFPVEGDEEYVDWHRIHLLDDLWGLWGHTFNSLVPPEKYFQTHPEYFSFFNGHRHNNQLCLSNPDVLEIAIESINAAIKDNPNATFWSISPNDDPSFCECDNCKKIDQLEGGPQGSLIYFVNKIAERFPTHHFTTLAYTYTAKPTKNIRPLDNVTIFLSNIDANRTLPIVNDTGAEPFRSQLKGWREKTDNVFIWDYYTQFTNYLAPFPNIYTIKQNLEYYRNMRVKGVFSQGSGETYSDMAELKSYLMAKLLWNPSLDIDSLMTDFLEGYYGRASKYVKQYIELIHKNVQNDTLQIYGNPINDHDGYLSLKNMDEYSSIMDEAEKAIEGNPVFEKRIQRIRLSQEYTFLQQSRFYGIEPHGIFNNEAGDGWQVNDRLKSRVEKFVASCIDNGVTELSEGGISPNQYLIEWYSIMNLGVKNNLALNAEIFDTKNSFETSFPAKGWRTLVDGNPGYDDYSYNWLCFYDKQMGLSLDLKAIKKVNKISLNFLVDPRHWIFSPQLVTVMVSEDGINYETIGKIDFKMMEESYQVSRVNAIFINTIASVRFIKVLAVPFDSLPDFRYHKTKKPMIASDEIWVE